jgi:hypothetical protein
MVSRSGTVLPFLLPSAIWIRSFASTFTFAGSGRSKREALVLGNGFEIRINVHGDEPTMDTDTRGRSLWRLAVDWANRKRLLKLRELADAAHRASPVPQVLALDRRISCRELSHAPRTVRNYLPS